MYVCICPTPFKYNRRTLCKYKVGATGSTLVEYDESTTVFTVYCCLNYLTGAAFVFVFVVVKFQ